MFLKLVGNIAGVECSTCVWVCVYDVVERDKDM